MLDEDRIVAERNETEIVDQIVTMTGAFTQVMRHKTHPTQSLAKQ